MLNKGFGGLLIIFYLFFFYSCSAKHLSQVVINGNIKSMPSGTVILCGSNNEGVSVPIDSTSSNNGRFSFESNEDIPLFLTLILRGTDGIKYLFHFSTNKKYKEGGLFSEYFMRDDTILINGTFKDFSPTNIVLNREIKLVYTDQPIIAGRQTYVFYNVDLNFGQSMTDSIVNILGDTIRKYNYSYYLLMELNKNRNKFSREQLIHLVSLFDGDRRRSNVAIELGKSIEFRSNKEISSTKFVDINNQEQVIDFAQSKITMLVLWASWCGPCRMEIPVLKKIFQKYSNNARFNLISISLDSKTEDWLRSLKEENMGWRQLRLPQNMEPFSKEIFHFDGSIPTTLFIDSKGTIFKTTQGYDDNLFNAYEEIIDGYLK
ncbi:MAG TPA: TlpA disulfide reductase family protein [Arachidicoccus sp.]|nr:TlpA disulfide reductase family protein [Arachidicoccus sp.]